MASFIRVDKIVEMIFQVSYTLAPDTHYSSVPNRRAGQNKRAGGKILKKH